MRVSAIRLLPWRANEGNSFHACSGQVMVARAFSSSRLGHWAKGCDTNGKLIPPRDVGSTLKDQSLS
jgi:hypothetical protein